MKRNCCVVIPAYQPGEEMIHYVAELLSSQEGPVVVVDDGSGASYGAVFGRVEEMEGCVVLRHSENRGKGAALKTAMAWYLEKDSAVSECVGIITADCDGQHSVKDVVHLSRVMVVNAKKGGRSLILGCRSFGEDTPGRSAMGNRMISLGMKMFYGIELEDTQTGLRGIPEALLPDLLKLSGDRYEYELNMLIYTRKACVPLIIVPIETIYFDNNKGTHFRAMADSARIFGQLCRGLAQYGFSSALSAAVDLLMYGLLIKWLLASMPFGERLFFAAAGARIVSSVINYTCNRRLPYVQNTKVFPTVLRYYALWIVQLTASIVFIWLLCTGIGMDEVAAKLLTDFVLAVFSYQVQMHWVFRSDEPGRRGAGVLAHGGEKQMGRGKESVFFLTYLQRRKEGLR